jgi:hypothetical protein
MANQITVTWAGDTTSLAKSNQEVARSAQSAGNAVGEAWDKNIEKADTLDTRAMGFRDTLTGLQDGAQGVKQAAAGDWGFETLLLLGFGIGDLASGMVNLVLPALKASRIATLAQAAATNIASAATKAFTVAQNFLKIAFLTSPIGWIVLAIGALIAVVVLIATKTTWFQTLWRNAWGWIKNAASNTWDWLKKVPGWIGQAFAKVADFVTRPFRTAFNFVARAWNNTIGGLSFTIPGWVPGIGGKGFSVPNIPTFHSGGVVPGIRGTAVPIMALAGERVNSLASGGGGGSVVFGSDGSRVGDAVLYLVREAVIRQFGSPAALGISS